MVYQSTNDFVMSSNNAKYPFCLCFLDGSTFVCLTFCSLGAVSNNLFFRYFGIGTYTAKAIYNLDILECDPVVGVLDEHPGDEVLELAGHLHVVRDLHKEKI